jgi:hypothetical protein
LSQVIGNIQSSNFMTSINPKAIFTLMFGLLLGLYILMDVLLARSSSLGQLYLLVAIGSFVLGLTNPRAAIYVTIFCTIYIDVFKRMMVIGGIPDFQNVAYVLAIPPLLIAGSVITLFLSFFMGNNKVTKDVIYSFICSIFVVGVTAVGIAVGDGQGAGKLSAVVNQGFYAFLFFVIPTLFRTDEERRKILHYTFVLLIPSAIYTFWQKKFGYADYEYKYLMSGLTIEAKNLVESVGGELRCFSTFNGSGTASTMYSIFVLNCLVSLKPGNVKPTFFQRLGKGLLLPIFVFAAYFTIIRTGWVGGLGTLAAYYFLGRKHRAYIGTLVGGVSLITTILLAPTAIKNNWLGEIEIFLQNTVGLVTDDPTVKRAIVMGTAKDRLQGWANLTEEPKIWQPFGFKFSGMTVNTSNDDFSWGHDAIVDSLIQFGYVPLFIILATGGYCYYLILQYMSSLDRKSQAFKNTRLCLAFAAAIVVGGLGHGATFRNFPQNFYFCLWLAIPFATYQQAMRERKQSRRDAQYAVGYPAIGSVPAMNINATTQS